MKTHLLSKLFFLCRYSLALFLLYLPVTAQTSFPAPQTLGPIESYGRNLQRTMTRLVTSTPQKRNTVKTLFYGQSITEQTVRSW